MHYTKFIPPLLITGGILLVPFIAMFFTEEVQWTLSDFVIMGALIFGVSLAYQFLSGRSGDVAYKGGIGLALLAVFLLVWINLAVGIIGSEDNPLNMLYLLIPMIGFVGTIIEGSADLYRSNGWSKQKERICALCARVTYERACWLEQGEVSFIT